MKKTLLVLTAVLTAVLLAACAAETTEPIDPSENADGGEIPAGGPAEPETGAPGEGGEEGEPLPPPGMSEGPTNEPGPVLVEQPDFGFIGELAPDDILVQLEIEPTFTLPQMMQPFGRVAPFTLYADGRVFYEMIPGEAYTERSIMTAQLSAEETVALMETLWDAGYGRVDSWEDMCAPGPEGDTPCIADAPYTVLKVRTSADELRTTRHYANFAEDMAALDNVLETLNTYSAEGAEVYVPQGATLLVRSGEGMQGEPVAWPLEVDLAEQLPNTDAINAPGGVVALNAEQAAKLTELLGYNAGSGLVETEDGTLIAFDMVPWLPGQDYTEDIATYINGGF